MTSVGLRSLFHGCRCLQGGHNAYIDISQLHSYHHTGANSSKSCQDWLQSGIVMQVARATGRMVELHFRPLAQQPGHYLSNQATRLATRPLSATRPPLATRTRGKRGIWSGVCCCWNTQSLLRLASRAEVPGGIWSDVCCCWDAQSPLRSASRAVVPRGMASTFQRQPCCATGSDVQCSPSPLARLVRQLALGVGRTA
jgi:hypothetical protein